MTRVVLESARRRPRRQRLRAVTARPHLINCAGLQAPARWRSAWKASPHGARAAAPASQGQLLHAAAGRAPFRRLIYPLPGAGGLGIHLTLDLAGQARFGPDVEWLKSADYEVDPARAARFETAIRAYWPALAAGALTPAYAGMRPKIFGPGEPAADFRIDDAAVHGVPAWSTSLESSPRDSRPRWRSPARPWPGWLAAAFS